MPEGPATTPCTSPGPTKITSPAWIGVIRSPSFSQPEPVNTNEHVLGLFMDVLGELVAGLIPGVVDGDVPSADLARHDDVRDRVSHREGLPLAVHIEDRRHGVTSVACLPRSPFPPLARRRRPAASPP